MKIYLCGDSTAANYTEKQAPQMGWGQALALQHPELSIENRAMAGRSTKSYLAEGRLTAIEQSLAPGDLLLIQFAHNDESELVWRHTDPDTSYVRNLTLFIATARLKGAAAALLTPLPLREFRDDQLQESHGPYRAAMHCLARQLDVPLLDVYTAGTELLSRLGEEESRKLYMHLEKGQYPAWPNGLRDTTHTCRAGAEAYAGIVYALLKEHRLI